MSLLIYTLTICRIMPTEFVVRLTQDTYPKSQVDKTILVFADID